MKKFLRMVLAVICGVLILWLIAFAVISGIASSAVSGTTPAVPSEGILKLDLSRVSILEQTAPDFSSISSQSTAQVGILQAVRAIDAASTDPSVKAIYLKTDGMSLGTGTIQEIRSALGAFRTSGKPVVAYFESPTTGGYYLASVADKIYMSPSQGGTPMFLGVGSRLVFFGDLLRDLGVNVQLIRHGKYKSAGESYTRGSASEENLYQNQVLVDAIWGVFRSAIASSRGISEDELDALLDNLSLCLPADFVQYGLVDELTDRETLENKLAVLAMKPSYEQVGIIPFDAYAAPFASAPSKSHRQIAVLYANGNIVDGLDKQNVDGDRYASIIEGLRKNPSVKAVVLRVNSPGGSVVASEKIRTELDKLSAEKPLIASYGDYAASGGYWISSGAQRIYSDAATLTGSIGVFSMLPDFSSFLSDKVHIGVQNVSSNEHSDMFSLTRPLDEEEIAFMQRSTEAVYSKFLALVSEGRGISPQEVDEIAQGRVWAGVEAKGIGLVDEIGGLSDALRYAAIGAGDADLSSWSITEYPEPRTMTDVWMEFTGRSTDDYSVSLRDFASNWYEAWIGGKPQYSFAFMPYIPVVSL